MSTRKVLPLTANALDDDPEAQTGLCPWNRLRAVVVCRQWQKSPVLPNNPLKDLMLLLGGLLAYCIQEFTI
jgi:hypothetical protein